MIVIMIMMYKVSVIHEQDDTIVDDDGGLLPMDHKKRKPGVIVEHSPEITAMGKHVSAPHMYMIICMRANKANKLNVG